MEYNVCKATFDNHNLGYSIAKHMVHSCHASLVRMLHIYNTNQVQCHITKHITEKTDNPQMKRK
jgi:cytochrome b subunit of formate dehydrogenase